MTRSEFDEDSSVANGTYEVEIVIDRPVSEVWNQFVNVGSWVTSHKIEEVGDVRRTLGAITRVSPSDAALENVQGSDGPVIPPPHYHYCKVIEFVPEQRYVLKTYAEKGGSYGMEGFSAFDDSRFYPLDGGRTRATFTLYSHMKGDLIARDPEAFARSMEGSEAGMVGNLENLKRIVESSAT